MDSKLIAQITERLDKELRKIEYGKSPASLYEPIEYIMNLGGKRLRPIFCLLTYLSYKKNWEDQIRPALAIEIFHNFTLMHDDIMDNAPLRRGKETVHTKWNTNIAILSGDVMLVKAYEQFNGLEPDLFKKVIQKFNIIAAQVCEGQQFDMDFETEKEVSISNYIKMIELKTAVLIGFSCWLGVMLATGNEQEAEKFYQYGTYVGIAFQLKDDILDVFGDAEKTGKINGGDIIANKKTFLLLKLIEMANPDDIKTINHWLNAEEFDADKKVEAIKSLYHTYNIKDLAEIECNSYYKNSILSLESIKYDKITDILTFSQFLLNRIH